MKTRIAQFLVPVMIAVLLQTGCTTRTKESPKGAATIGDKSSDGKSYKSTGSDLEEYDALTIADPLQPLNRATFTLNHGIYTDLFRPISKGYQAVVPQKLRTGVHNMFENVKFPVRFVNDTLQGKFDRAGLETGRFLVNSTVGVGGFGRPSDHIPALANVPAGDTGQTLAKWGIAHGIYLVLPILGPSSTRDTVGLAGDYALNPVTWVSIIFGGATWTLAIPTTNTVRSLPPQMDAYDAATKDSLDRYLAARSAYLQYRKQVAEQ